MVGAIYSVNVMNPGTGYGPSVASAKIVSTLTPSDPYPQGAGLQTNIITNDSGVITGVIVVNGGAGYTNISPQLVITDPGIRCYNPSKSYWNCGVKHHCIDNWR